MRLVLPGTADATLNDGATIIGIAVSGNAKLKLNGTTASLAGEISINGSVDAYGLAATRVYITTTQNARALVKPVNIFHGSANDESRIFYKGDPANKQLETSGNGQIIKE